MVGQALRTRNATRFLTVLAVLAAATWAPGCGSESESSANIEAATYNVGLAYGFVPYAKERKEAINTAVAAISADLLCLQEVWLDEDIKAIEAAGKAAGFTHVHYAKTPEVIATPLPAACTAGDTKDLQPCAEKNCGTVSAGELSGCVLGFCSVEFNATSTACQGCLATNLGKPLQAILDTCGKPGGGKYSYGGYNGLMLLSRLPLKDTKHTVMDSLIVRRAVLEATATAPAPIGDVSVLCTHLTANLSSLQYPDKSSSWGAEQAKQIDVMTAKVKATGGRSIILGDMNTGPDLEPGIKAELPDNYAKFIAAGLKAPYAKAGATCTFCGDNTLVKGGSDKGGEAAVIDHVFLAGTWDSGATGMRIVDSQVTIKVAGKDMQSHVSDHYGVSVNASVTVKGD